MSSIHPLLDDHSDLATIKSLLESDEDPNMQDDDGKTALMVHRDIDLKDKYNETALMQHADVNIVKLLLEHGADPNEKNDNGGTPLVI